MRVVTPNDHLGVWRNDDLELAFAIAVQMSLLLAPADIDLVCFRGFATEWSSETACC